MTIVDQLIDVAKQKTGVDPVGGHSHLSSSGRAAVILYAVKALGLPMKSVGERLGVQNASYYLAADHPAYVTDVIIPAMVEEIGVAYPPNGKEDHGS